MIIHRSFIREVLQLTSTVAVILLSILLVTRVVYFLREAAQGDIPIGSVALLGVLKMVAHLDIVISLVLYIAIQLVMTRWVRDQEMTVIRACGVGLGHFLRPAFILFLGVGFLVALLSLYLAPLSAEMTHIQEQEIRHRSDVSGMLPGVFHETRGGQRVLFIGHHPPATDNFQEVFVYDRMDEGGQIVVSDTAVRTVDRESGQEYLVLQDGTLYRGQAGSTGYEVLRFETYGLPLPNRLPTNAILPPKARQTRDLMTRTDPVDVGQLHWRLSKVAMLPVLMLLALALSSARLRATPLPHMVMALGIYIIYFHCLGLARAMVEREIANPYLSLWAVHAVFLLLALILFYRRSQDLPLSARASVPT